MPVLLGSIKRSSSKLEKKINDAISDFLESWYYLSRAIGLNKKLDAKLYKNLKVYNDVYDYHLKKYNRLSNKHKDIKGFKSLPDNLTQTVLKLQESIFKLRDAANMVDFPLMKNDLNIAADKLVKEYNKLTKITEKIV